MKLKEQFEKAYCTNSFSQQLQNYERVADKLSIGFALWLCENNYFIYGIPIEEQNKLLENYKKEKGL